MNAAIDLDLDLVEEIGEFPSTIDAFDPLASRK